MFTYYKAVPLWKDNSRDLSIEGWGRSIFAGDDSIVHQKFETIEDAILAAKQDGTLLRPADYKNNTGWEFSKHSWFGLLKTVIPLESLVNQGLLSDKIDEDSIGKIYNFK